VVAVAVAPPPAAEAAAVVLDAEADRWDVVAALRDPLEHALVALRYAVDAVAAGTAPASSLGRGVDVTLTALRQAERDARSHALAGGLRVALRDLAARYSGDRLADGRPALAVSVVADDAALDLVAPALAVTVERVADAALRDAAGTAALVATCDGCEVKLSVKAADTSYDAGELDRWSRRADGLGGRLSVRPDGVDLQLPVHGPDDTRTR
jgi:hypothetical protein